MSIENCLIKIPRLRDEFSIASVIQAVGDHQKDGFARKDAEARAVADHIADLEVQRDEIQQAVAAAYAKRAPKEAVVSEPAEAPSVPQKAGAADSVRMERIATSAGPAFCGT